MSSQKAGRSLKWSLLSRRKTRACSLAGSNEHMLDNEVTTDLTFLVGKPPHQQEIHTHKYVLMSRSPAFFSILHEDASNTEEPIELPEAALDAFKASILSDGPSPHAAVGGCTSKGASVTTVSAAARSPA